MIQKFELTGIHVEIDDKLRHYVLNKLGSLDRYMPRHNRDVANMEVRLREAKFNGRIQAVCETVLYLPHETISLTERAVTMYAAIDLVKPKLKQRIQRYKDESSNGQQRRHMFGRFTRKLSSLIP